MNNIQPYSSELERSVLAALMNESSVIAIIGDIVSEETFYIEKHRMVWGAIKKIISENKIPDMLSVIEEMRSSGSLQKIGGAAFVSEVATSVSSIANVEAHSMYLKQCEIKRKLFIASNNLMKLSIDPTVDSLDCIDEMLKSADNIAFIGGIRKPKSNSEIIKEITDIMLKAGETNGITGIPSGIRVVDEMFCGWQSPDLIIIAGRPAMGKTGFAITLCDNAAVDFGKKVLFFSLEMSSRQIMARRISKKTGVSAKRILNSRLSVDESEIISKCLEGLSSDQNFIIDDAGGISINELSTKARRMKLEKGIDMIVVDYLQLLSDKVDGNREQEISSISRKLKALAKSLNIPVIALSQLSRAPETRGGERRPHLSDLRESGAIEQDADIVIFPYRPEYYGITEDAEGNSTKGMAILIVAKHRNGGTGELVVSFRNQSASFHDQYTEKINKPDPDGWIIPAAARDHEPF